MKPFIKGHIVRVLTQFQQEIDIRPFGAYRLPAFEIFLKKYLKSHKDIFTPSDNPSIITNCFKLLRFKTFIDYRFECKDWSERLENISQVDEITPDSMSRLDIPLYAKCSCPPELFELIAREHSQEKAFVLCSNMLFTRPKTVLRVNPNKITREKLMQTLQRNYKIISKKTEFSPLGLQILEKDYVNLYKTKEYLMGLFEPQAEACQLSVLKPKPHENDKVLDYRCNLAEKSIAFGNINRGLRIYLYDERENLFDVCQKSFQRNDLSFKPIDNENGEGSFDWVLMEMPSTETGLLREKPELKLKFSQESFEDVLGKQRKYLEESIRFLKPKSGKLVVFSNSIIKEENIEQLKRLCAKQKMEVLDGKVFQAFPNEEGMIGHFSAILTQK